MRINTDQVSGTLEKRLAPAWLIVGDEALLTGEPADAVRARARAEGYCKIYVIEDLHAARQYYPHEISTLELLKTKWSSPYTNQNEQNYIGKYMKVGEIYEPSFYSSTAIIYNKYYV